MCDWTFLQLLSETKIYKNFYKNGSGVLVCPDARFLQKWLMSNVMKDKDAFMIKSKSRTLISRETMNS